MSTLGQRARMAPDHVAQHERHLGPVRGLAGAQDHRHRLAGDRLVDVDRQEAALVVVGVEERELLVAVDRGPRCRRCRARSGAAPRSKLSQNSSTMAAIIRLSAVARGQVLQPAHGRLRAQVRPALGQPADRHLEGRVGAQRVAVVGVRVAGRDQQHPEADHLGQRVAHPLRRPRVREAARQALGDARAGARSRPAPARRRPRSGDRRRR